MQVTGRFVGGNFCIFCNESMEKGEIPQWRDLGTSLFSKRQLCWGSVALPQPWLLGLGWASWFWPWQQLPIHQCGG